MGLFGSKARDVELEPVTVDNEEQFDEVPSLPSPLSSTVIATGVTVSGTLEGEGVIQVEGTVKGEICLRGAVVVTTTGVVKGPISAEVIQIAGCVEGNCVARDHMCLEKTGSLEGDVTTLSLVVHDGGRLNGRSNMVKEIPESATHAASTQEQDLQFGPNYKSGEEESPAAS